MPPPGGRRDLAHPRSVIVPMPRSRTTPPRFPAFTNAVPTPAAGAPLASDHSDVARRLFEVERRLRESEERSRLLFEASPRAMWVYDVETLAFLAVNEAAVQQAIASVREAELNLSYTKVAAPVAGVSGRAQRSIGSLITALVGAILLIFLLRALRRA